MSKTLFYTSFEYSDMIINDQSVMFTLTNTGKFDGAEVAQLYVGLPGAKVFRPLRELKGFVKVYLKAGESRTIRISFDDKTFRYWNVKTDNWETEGGCYQILIGASVEDIRLEGQIEIAGTTKGFPYDADKMPLYESGLIQHVEDEEFQALLGHGIPSGKWSGELGVNDAICQMYYAKSRLARFIYRRLTSMKKKSEEKGKPDLNILFIYNMPFRGIAKMTSGVISMEMVRGMVLLVNGHFFRGMKKIIGGFFANQRANRTYGKVLLDQEGNK